MKRIIAALLLTAAVGTPALAGGFNQSGATTPSPAFAYNETASGKTYRAPTSQWLAPRHNAVYAADMDRQHKAQIGKH